MGKSRDKRNARAKKERTREQLVSHAMRKKWRTEYVASRNYVGGRLVTTPKRLRFKALHSSTNDSAAVVTDKLKAHGQQRKAHLNVRGHSIAMSMGGKRPTGNRARKTRTYKYEP